MTKSCLAISVSVVGAVCAWGGVEEKGNAASDRGILIDVRTAAEFKEGHLGKAINIPHTEIAEKIGAFVTNKADRIVLYCRSGNRSGIAEGTLRAMGYTNIVNAGAYAKLKEQEAKDASAGARSQDSKAGSQIQKTDLPK